MSINPVVHMVTPGRRAYGETWSKVTITPNPDTGGYDVHREDTDAPADNKAIFVPALGNISLDMADYILEHERKEAEYRAKNPEPRQRRESYGEKVNRMFHDYCEQRLKYGRGATVSGPGGWTQRERM